MHRFTYQILDPFDRTYNPSKAALEGSEVDKLFRKAMDFSFIDLLTDQKLEAFTAHKKQRQ